MRSLTLILGCLALSDMGFTLYELTCLGATELNPLLAWAYQYGGPPAFILTKVTLTALSLLLLDRVDKWASWVAIGIYAAVCVGHVWTTGSISSPCIASASY